MAQEDWRSLFNGHTLTGWAATGKPEGWVVDHGCIACAARGGGYLYTQEQFENFALSLDFRIVPGARSGVFFRWSDLADPVNTGFELQLLDTFGHEPPGEHDCGALCGLVAPAAQAVRPAGEWNEVLVCCQGPVVRIDLNGQCVVEADTSHWTEAGRNPDGSQNPFAHAWADMPRKGHIGIRDYGGRVWFRNVRLRELGQD